MDLVELPAWYNAFEQSGCASIVMLMAAGEQH